MPPEAENPYGSFEPVSAGLIDPNRVYYYGELPQSCPNCDREFSRTYFRRLYPKKFRLRTILFFIFLTFAFFYVYLAQIPAILLAGWAFRWNKKVTMRCLRCGWSHRFVVY